MVRRWIGSLRNKPKSVRDNVALSVAGELTALVVLGWLFVTPTTVTDVIAKQKRNQALFQLFGQLRDQTAAVTDSFCEAKAVTEEWEDAQASSSTETTVSIEAITVRPRPS